MPAFCPSADNATPSTGEFLLFGIECFVQKHLDVGLVAQSAFGGKLACSGEFVFGNANRYRFGGARQVSLAQVANPSLLLGSLETFN